MLIKKRTWTLLTQSLNTLTLWVFHARLQIIQPWNLARVCILPHIVDCVFISVPWSSYTVKQVKQFMIIPHPEIGNPDIGHDHNSAWMVAWPSPHEEIESKILTTTVVGALKNGESAESPISTMSWSILGAGKRGTILVRLFHMVGFALWDYHYHVDCPCCTFKLLWVIWLYGVSYNLHWTSVGGYSPFGQHPIICWSHSWFHPFWIMLAHGIPFLIPNLWNIRYSYSNTYA